MAGPRAHDPKRLDVAAFAAAGDELEGRWSAERLARLTSATLPPLDGARAGVGWQVQGERAALLNAGVQPALDIHAGTEVTLECQRCLQPMTVRLQAERRIFFVDGEDAAAALDAESEDDVLALTPALDLEALIEDELLLALPLIPRHDICPQPLPRPFVDRDAAEEPADHPFAALAALRRGSLPS
ncbi:MAG TPA: DUF177 domain-containing protein [Caldimonas sp.]